MESAGLVTVAEVRSDVALDACDEPNGAQAVDATRNAESSMGFLTSGVQRTVRLVRTVSFWAAVILPFLVVTGLSSIDQWTLLLAVLSLNGISLYVGHPYCRPV